MGCFDTVLVPCPSCGTKEGFQSKSGGCLLNTYELDEAPADVMDNVNRHSPHTCSKCGTLFEVVVEVVVQKVVKGTSVVHDPNKEDPDA